MYRKMNYNTRLILKIFLDSFAIIFAFVFGYFLRFPWDAFLKEMHTLGYFLIVVLVVRLVCFSSFRLYSTMWRYSELPSIMALMKATAVGSILLVISHYFLLPKHNIPRSIPFIDFLCVVFLAGSFRFSIRYFTTRKRDTGSSTAPRRRVLIYGAGDTGEQLLRNIQQSKIMSGIDVVGFIDDDSNKRSQYIHGKRVLGGRNDVSALVKQKKITGIYFCVPSLSGSETRELFRSINEQVGSEIEILTIPGLSDLVQGRISINVLRKFELSDLLRRSQVHLEREPVEQLIKDQVVLIVGGGGSIGLELCRQVAGFLPKELVVVDASEFNTYTAEQVLRKSFPKLNLTPLVADACNNELLRNIFERTKPAIVFHAAAYKHVPLMEENPWAAIYNNLTSTLQLTRFASEFGVKRFILISSDKAVKPTSVMGATKRMCELIMLLEQQHSNTDFMAVRFGNVLGSSGSVIPLFQQQITNGGPITVTHPEITRFFMLISEAVELVLQAGAVGASGQIYVLDMGKPIRIAELAEYMIEICGLRPHRDIKIEYTGLRPGEKLYESLYFEGEETPTRVPNLFVLQPKLSVDQKYIAEIEQLIVRNPRLSRDELMAEIKRFVPEFITNGNG